MVIVQAAASSPDRVAADRAVDEGGRSTPLKTPPPWTFPGPVLSSIVQPVISAVPPKTSTPPP